LKRHGEASLVDHFTIDLEEVRALSSERRLRVLVLIRDGFGTHGALETKSKVHLPQQRRMG